MWCSKEQLYVMNPLFFLITLMLVGIAVFLGNLFIPFFLIFFVNYKVVKNGRKNRRYN